MLQEWLSIGGSVSLTSLGQGADRWVDLGDIEDVVLTLEVTNVAGDVTMNYETSCSIEEASFVSCVVPFILTTGVRSDSVLAAYANVPVQQYLRWRISTSGSYAWNVMFRIWLSTYSLVD